MGFDIYGMNPQINEDYPPRFDEIMKKYGDGSGWLDWSKDIPEEIKNEYYAIQEKHQESNPGEYFRNNVWGWRPLWGFVCEVCHDILTDKDVEGGCYNDGHEISKTKAIQIGNRLSKLIANGFVDETDREQSLSRAKAISYNEIIEEELEELKKEVEDKFNKKLVPAEYPEPYNSKWNEIYAKKKWEAHYGFDRENVKEFALFCLESGGFQIC